MQYYPALCIYKGYFWAPAEFSYVVSHWKILPAVEQSTHHNAISERAVSIVWHGESRSCEHPGVVAVRGAPPLYVVVFRNQLFFDLFK